MRARAGQRWLVVVLGLAVAGCEVGGGGDAGHPDGGRPDGGADAGLDTSSDGIDGGACVPTPEDGGRAWRVVCPSGKRPSPRWAPAMAYDARRGVVVLFGGYVPPRYLGDTWEYADGGWSQARPLASPPPRSLAAMAFDAARGVMVLFGGQQFQPDAGSGTRALGDAWTYDGRTWTPHSALPLPPARVGAGMAYDARRELVVLYGGASSTFGSPALGDTWQWDGGTWASPSLGSPPAREVFSLAYDDATSSLLFVGGSSGTGPLGGTWGTDGESAWGELAGPPPPAQFAGSLVRDGVRGEVLLVGGTDGTTPLATTWRWEPPTWQPGPPLPAPRGWTGAAFDAARGRVVVFGGYGTGAAPVSGETLEY